jgi:putative phosphoesterase
MDPEAIKNILPEKEIFNIGKFKFGLAHGIGAPANLIDLLSETFKDDKVDVVIFGHSHSPCNENKNGILFFNPGSPTDKVFAPYNSVGIIEINDKIEARIVKL